MPELKQKIIYEKIQLTEEQLAAGNLKEYDQLWDIVYYKETKDFMDNVVLRTFERAKKDLDNPKKYALRSIYFKYPAQLKSLAFELLNAYFYFMVIRNEIPPNLPISEYRKILLDGLIKDFTKFQIAKWQYKMENYRD